MVKKMLVVVPMAILCACLYCGSASAAYGDASGTLRNYPVIYHPSSFLLFKSGSDSAVDAISQTVSSSGNTAYFDMMYCVPTLVSGTLTVSTNALSPFLAVDDSPVSGYRQYVRFYNYVGTSLGTSVENFWNQPLSIPEGTAFIYFRFTYRRSSANAVWPTISFYGSNALLSNLVFASSGGGSSGDCPWTEAQVNAVLGILGGEYPVRYTDPNTGEVVTASTFNDLRNFLIATNSATITGILQLGKMIDNLSSQMTAGFDAASSQASSNYFSLDQRMLQLSEQIEELSDSSAAGSEAVVDAVQQAQQANENYWNNASSSAAESMDQSNQQTNAAVDYYIGQEDQLISDFSDDFDAVAIDKWELPPFVIGAAQLISEEWNYVFASLKEANVLIIFPLMVGLATAILRIPVIRSMRRRGGD